MNHIYKVVFNKATGTFMAVAEYAKAHGKKANGAKSLVAGAIFTPVRFVFTALASAFVLMNGAMGATVTNPTFSTVVTADGTTRVCSWGADATGYIACGSLAIANTSQGVAIGAQAQATGSQAIAVGGNTKATGNSSVAVGGDDLDAIAGTTTATQYNTLTGDSITAGTYKGTVSGNGSVAVGVQADASGDLSTAFGTRSTATGFASSAFGMSANASGDTSLAMGTNSKAQAKNSVTIGKSANATSLASDSIAMGTIAKTNVANGIAIGNGANVGYSSANTATNAYGSNGIAMGTGATAQSKDVIAIGNGAKETFINPGNNNNGAILIGQGINVVGNTYAGTYASVAPGATVVIGANAKSSLGMDGSSGNSASVVIGPSASADNSSGSINFSPSTVIGHNAHATAGTAVAIGAAKASNANAIAIGGNGGNNNVYATTASGDGAFALGTVSNSTSLSSLAFGRQANALSNGAIAIGQSAVGSGVSAVAIGGNPNGYDGTFNPYDTSNSSTSARARGDYSLAMGSGAISNKTGDIAHGLGSVATGYSTLSTGTLPPVSSITAETFGSALAQGNYAQATGRNAIAIGNNAKANGTSANTSVADLIAIGGNSVANGNKSTAVGYKANTGVAGDSAVALGNTATATNVNAIAIGKGAQATGSQSISIGTGNIVSGTNSGTIGDPTINNGTASYTMGNDNAVGSTTSEAFILGNNNQLGGTATYDPTTGKLILANGVTDTLPANSSTAVGNRNLITSSNTYVLGSGINTTGTNNTISGLNGTVKNSVYLGDDSVVTAGAGSVDTSGNGSLRNALLNSTTAGNTTTAGATGTVSSGTVNGLTYGGFAGQTAVGAIGVGASGAERRIQNMAAGEISKTSTDAINGSQLYATQQVLGNVAQSTANNLGGNSTVGTDGNLTAPAYNVVYGTTSPNTAGNGTTQFGTTANNVGAGLTNLNNYVNQGFNIKDNAGTTQGVVTPSENVQFVNGVGTASKVTTEVNGTTKIQYDLNQATKDSLAKADSAMQTLTTSVNGVNAETLNQTNKDINFVNGTGTTARANGQDITFDVNTDNQTIKVDTAGNLVAITNPLTVAPTGIVNMPATDTALVTAKDVANAINESGWNLQANGDTQSLVKTGNTVQFLDGKNIKITRNGNDITVNTADDVSFNTATLTNPTSVASGGSNNYVTEGNKNAVNGGDVYYAIQNTAQQYTGDNGTLVTRKPSEILTIKGGATTATENNIQTVANTDGSIAVKLAKNIDLSPDGSVKLGNTTVNNQGVTVTGGTNPVTLTNTGLDNGGNKVINVAPATLSSTSTDAVNGSQLYQTNQNVTNNATTIAKGFNITADNGTADNVQLGETVNHTSSDKNIVTTVSDNQIDFKLNNVVKVGTTNPVTISGDAGTINGLTNKTFDPNNYVTGQAATEDQLKAVSTSITATELTSSVKAGTNIANVDTKTDGNNTEYTINAKGSKVSAGKGVTVTPSDVGNNVTDYQVDVKTDGITTQIDGNGNISAIVGGLNVTNGKVDTPNAPNALTTTQTVANAINNSGFNVTSGKTTGIVNGTTTQLIHPSDTVTLQAGDNMVLDQAGGTFTYSVSKTPVFEKVTTSGLTVMPNSNIDMGNNKITNVQAGEAGNDAVNVSQLNAVASNAKTSSVKAGTNIANVTPQITGVNTEYTVNANGTTASAGSNYVKVTAGTKDANNVTDYQVDLNDTAKTSLGKADSALQTIITQIDGQPVKTISQTNNTANFVTGDNMVLSNDGNGGIKVATAKNVNFDSVTTGGLTVKPNSTVNMGGNVVTNMGSGLQGKTLDQIKAEGNTSPQWNNGATIGDLTQVQTNVTNVSNQVTNMNSVIGGQYIDQNGNLTPEGQLLLKTYNVSDDKVYITNSVIDAISKMNQEGIKYFHVNDATPGTNNPGIKSVEGDSNAAGSYAVSVGYDASASATNSVAMGHTASAVGNNAIAIGNNAKALNENTISIGNGNTVTGQNSGAIGDPNNVTGNNSYVLGNTNTVTSDNSFAVGNNTSVTANGGVAIGNNAKTTVAGGVALGENSVANRAGLGANVTVSTTTADPSQNQVYALPQSTTADRDAIIATATNTAGAVSVGSATGGNRQITNVAAGSADSDAVNVAQLKAAANTAAIAAVAAKTTLTNGKNTTVTPTTKTDGSTNYTVDVNTDGTTITTNGAGQLIAVTSPLTNTATGAVNTPTAPNALATAGDVANAVNNSGFTLTAQGANGSLVKPASTVNMQNTDGNIVISKSSTDNTVNYDLAKNVHVDSLAINNSNVALNSGGLNNGGNRITNVAEGKAPTDAVNVSQLNNLGNNVNNALNQMGYRLGDIEDNANAGTSAAMATAALPQAYLPGKSMLSGGMASYNGQGAAAIGISKLSDNGRWVIKVNGTADTQGNYGGAVGAGFHW